MVSSKILVMCLIFCYVLISSVCHAVLPPALNDTVHGQGNDHPLPAAPRGTSVQAKGNGPPLEKPRPAEPLEPAISLSPNNSTSNVTKQNPTTPRRKAVTILTSTTPKRESAVPQVLEKQASTARTGKPSTTATSAAPKNFSANAFIVNSTTNSGKLKPAKGNESRKIISTTNSSVHIQNSTGPSVSTKETFTGAQTTSKIVSISVEETLGGNSTSRENSSALGQSSAEQSNPTLQEDVLLDQNATDIWNVLTDLYDDTRTYLFNATSSLESLFFLIDASTETLGDESGNGTLLSSSNSTTGSQTKRSTSCSADIAPSRLRTSKIKISALENSRSEGTEEAGKAKIQSNPATESNAEFREEVNPIPETEPNHRESHKRHHKKHPRRKHNNRDDEEEKD